MYNKTSIKRNILTVKQNTSRSRSGLGLISTPGTAVYFVSFPLYTFYLFIFIKNFNFFKIVTFNLDIFWATCFYSFI